MSASGGNFRLIVRRVQSDAFLHTIRHVPLAGTVHVSDTQGEQPTVARVTNRRLLIVQ